jgi:hypothetical protein
MPPKKYIEYLKIKKGANNSYGGYPTNLQAEPKIPKKKYWNKSANQNKKFPKKTVFHTLKVERSQKFVPKEICKFDLKS